MWRAAGTGVGAGAGSLMTRSHAPQIRNRVSGCASGSVFGLRVAQRGTPAASWHGTSAATGETEHVFCRRRPVRVYQTGCNVPACECRVMTSLYNKPDMACRSATNA